MLQMVRELHKAGHTIIIHTARRMRTHHGNVSAVVADIGAITINSLKQFHIPYHEVSQAGNRSASGEVFQPQRLNGDGTGIESL